jgi:signal transduction histidine kinase
MKPLMENKKMKRAKVFIGFSVLFIFLSLPLLRAGTADRIKAIGDRLQEAGSPADKAECLAALLELHMREDPQKAREYGTRALKVLEGHRDDRLKVRVLLGICGASCGLGEYSEALDRGKQAETLARKINDKSGLAVVSTFLANIYLDLSDFDKALSHAYEGRKMSEAVGNRGGTASALNSIARVHRNMGEYEEALVNYQKALEISEKLGNKSAVATLLSNIANVYLYLQQYRKALEFYTRGLKIMKEVGSERGIAQIMCNIADVYSRTGKYTQALQNDKKALELFKKTGSKGNIAYVLGSIGRDYGKMKNYPKALEYMEKGLEMARERGSKDTVRMLYEQYTNIYETMGNHKNALLYHRKFKDINDEILNEDRNRRIAHLQVLYEVDKKEKENQLLKKNNHIQKLQRNSLAMLSALVVIIALVIYYRYRTRKKTEKVLRASEQKLKKMNAAKDKLFTIIAHDLGSPLNSLLLSSAHLENHFQSLEEQDRKEFIHNIYRQTRDMSDLLENLLQWATVQIGKIQQNRETMDIRLVAEETLRQIMYTAQKKKIHLSSHIRENTLARADKHMMKTVMRNLVSNAVKYTHPGGEVKITSKNAGNRVEITVSDNGVGMDKEKAERLFLQDIIESTRGTANEKGTGLGLALCKEFVEKNGGEIRVQSQPDRGSHFSFTLPGQQ